MAPPPPADYGDAFTVSGPAFERLQRHYRNASLELVARGHARRTPQPEESKAASEFPGSIRTSPENAPTAAPKLPPNPPNTALAPTQPYDASANEPIQRNMAANAVPYQADFAKS